MTSPVLPYESPTPPKQFKCGTLTYSKRTLALLFFWLFWGDICYTLMENMGGPIMQLKFEDLHSSNKTYMLFANTFPTLIFLFMNPIISFKSDRFRSKLGRRIPFIILTLPFLTAGLVALAYCNQIGDWLFHKLEGSALYSWAMESWFHRQFFVQGLSGTAVSATIVGAILVIFVLFVHNCKRWGWRLPYWTVALPLFLISALVLYRRAGITGWINYTVQQAEFSQTSVVIVTIGALLVAFTFFNTIFTSMYWYLFRDVVPENVLARFMSWFRVISLVTFGMYKWFIFPHSRTHATEIFLSAAAIYLVGFGLMMLFVREGKYPPPSPYVGGHKGPLAAVLTYGKECHSHTHYWYFWMLTFVGSIGGGVGAFNLYFQERIGLDLQQIGRIDAITTYSVAVMVLGVGWLADRYHPIRVIIAASLLGVLVTPINLIWLFWHPPATAVFHIMGFDIRQVFLVQGCIAVGLGGPVAALSSMWDPVLLMRVFPHERFGQFASTNSLWRTSGGLLGGLLAASALDIVATWVGRDNAYFYMPFWQIAFGLPAFLLLLKFYQSWKRYGGDESYVPPKLEAPPEAPVPGEPVIVHA